MIEENPSVENSDIDFVARLLESEVDGIDRTLGSIRSYLIAEFHLEGEVAERRFKAAFASYVAHWHPFSLGVPRREAEIIHVFMVIRRYPDSQGWFRTLETLRDIDRLDPNVARNVLPWVLQAARNFMPAPPVSGDEVLAFRDLVATVANHAFGIRLSREDRDLCQAFLIWIGAVGASGDVILDGISYGSIVSHYTNYASINLALRSLAGRNDIRIRQPLFNKWIEMGVASSHIKPKKLGRKGKAKNKVAIEDGRASIMAMVANIKGDES